VFEELDERLLLLHRHANGRADRARDDQDRIEALKIGRNIERFQVNGHISLLSYGAEIFESRIFALKAECCMC